MSVLLSVSHVQLKVMAAFSIKILVLALLAITIGCHSANPALNEKSQSDFLSRFWENEYNLENRRVPESLLHSAIEKGDRHTVEQRLKDGFSIDEKNQFGNTALHLAVIKGEFDLVAFLLKKGANPDQVNHGKQTPLHFAALAGKVKIAVLLINNGASLNPLDHEHWTPLDCSLWKGKGVTYTNIEGKKAVADLLIKNGAQRGEQISPHDH